MRWDELFADIEGQLEQELASEHRELAVEEERLRLGRLGMRDRIAAMRESERELGILLADGQRVSLRVDTVGRDWLAGEVHSGVACTMFIVPIAAISAVFPVGDQLDRGLKPANAAPDLSAQLGVTFVLRDLCRRRVGLELVTRVGSCFGTIDRVGRDHLDLAEHERGEARRDRVVRRIRIVSFETLVCVRV